MINRDALVDGAVEYIRKNAIVIKSAKGKEYLTVPNFSEATVGDTTGQVRFAFMALRPASEASQRASSNVDRDVEKLTPEAKRALLEKLMAEVG